MEFYAAYTDYKWVMDFTEAVDPPGRDRRARHGHADLQGRELDLAKPFHRLTIVAGDQEVRTAIHERATRTTAPS